LGKRQLCYSTIIDDRHWKLDAGSWLLNLILIIVLVWLFLQSKQPVKINPDAYINARNKELIKQYPYISKRVPGKLFCMTRLPIKSLM